MDRIRRLGLRRRREQQPRPGRRPQHRRRRRTASYVAWADSRSGVYQIDVDELTATGWQSLGSLSLGGAIVATAGASLRPSITLGANGQPVVAWTVFNGSSSDIFVAQYNPTVNGGAGGWVAVGQLPGLRRHQRHGQGRRCPDRRDGLRPGGRLRGPVERRRERLCRAVHRRQVGRAGQRRRQRHRRLGIEHGRAGRDDRHRRRHNVAVAWSQTVGATSQIYLREYSSGTWNQLAGSASGNGLSNSTGQALTPTLAFNDGIAVRRLAG